MGTESGPRGLSGSATPAAIEAIEELRMAIPATQMKVGSVIQFEDDLWIVVSLQHVKLSKGPGAMQAKLKNLKRGDHIQHRFRSADKVEPAYLEKTSCEYLYADGDTFVFMDVDTYEQHHLHRDFVGEQMKFITDNERVGVTFHEGKPIAVELPAAVELVVTYTEPGFKGDSATNTFKPATMSTGIEVRVPNHINIGDRLKVSTDTGEFIERVN